ncbi:hypothetical protein BASA83_008677 [Batrachochytrium salamandrivorans]|nr:hypothetical protein BASA83_008677 [Batrachochytrium salamandrivorans]
MVMMPSRMQLKYCTLRFCTVSLQALEIKQVAGSARPGISTIVMAPSARVNPNANITGQTGHIDDMSEMYGSEHDSWNSDYSDGSIVASQPGSLPPKALADSLSALTIPIHDPAFFFTLKGFINLVVAPLFPRHVSRPWRRNSTHSRGSVEADNPATDRVVLGLGSVENSFIHLISLDHGSWDIVSCRTSSNASAGANRTV